MRRAAVARTLFAPTDLASALERPGFVQADPIRAPARAPDLVSNRSFANARVIGWVNVTATLDAPRDARHPRIAVKAGYVGKRPGSASFRAAFDAEVQRFENFLGGAEAMNFESA